MAAKPFDIHPISARLYLLPVQTRLPMMFGHQTLTHITCARACVRVADRAGHEAEGWGETPLSVQWVWPSALPYQARHDALVAFCQRVCDAYAALEVVGHPMEVGHAFLEQSLPNLLAEFNASRGEAEPMPYLAALVCASAFDIALHDAYGILHGVPTYETYNAQFMNLDLSRFMRPAGDARVSFAGLYPEDFFEKPRLQSLIAWHMIGGKDWLEAADQDGPVPTDGYPYLLRDWIHRDGLKCLKLKLRGDDAAWDYQRLVNIGKIACEENIDWLCADFNCTATSVEQVSDILDRLMREHPRIYGKLLYIEQPFAYDLEAHQLDVHGLSARKPLMMDESAHDWRLIQLGRQLGWNSVALKTCKTQTGALLSLCWAKAHGMTVMVHDLTNPMLAQVAHVQLAAHAGTIIGLETNAPQFYPDASTIEAAVHPGIYRRTNGMIQLDTVGGPGLGYRLERMHRQLPPPYEAPALAGAV